MENLAKLYRRTYDQPNPENLQELINDLEQKGGKRLSNKLIRQHIFKIKAKEKELKIIARCNIKAAIEYLKVLSTKDINVRDVQTVIADLKTNLEHLGYFEELDFIIISTNTIPSTIHYYQARDLFYDHNLRKGYQNNYDLDIAVLYMIRLALEKRLLKFLGIDFITNNNKPVGLSSILPIVKNLKNVDYPNDLSWEEVDWILKWLNHHMHRHLRPAPWKIHQAFESLNHLLMPTSNKPKGFDFYGSTSVMDHELLDKEIEEKIKNKFADINIKWLTNKERAANRNGS